MLHYATQAVETKAHRGEVLDGRWRTTGRQGAFGRGHAARAIVGGRRDRVWSGTAAQRGLSADAAYRLTRRACVYGDGALEDHRHGHVAKMHAPVRQWLEAYCRGAPGLSSRLVQAALRERFGVTVSITHLNRVRASLGIGRRPTGGGGKKEAPHSHQAKK